MDIVSRVKNILVTPATEWQVIAAEPGDIPGLYRNYVFILAAIPAVGGFIGAHILSHSSGVGFGLGLGAAIGRYVLGIVGVYIVGFVISKLAPRYGAPENRPAGMKVAAYANTAAWVFGVFLIIPALGWVDGLAGLYGLYLLYLGLPIVMGTPQSNTPIYLVVTIASLLVVYLVIGVVLAIAFAGSAII